MYGAKNISKSTELNLKNKKVVRREFHPNGKPKSEKTYINGKLHGTSRFYSRDGTIWAIQRSKNGIKESMEFRNDEIKQ
jgi:antitoxin component YwqK of YwqJK toxin-antitoxin module